MVEVVSAGAVESVMHFTDERIEAIKAGSPMTPEEREFLVRDTPRFEECSPYKADDIRDLPDAHLMRFCYSVWSDYARGQI